MCAGSADDDPIDDAVGGTSLINDGCPASGAAETGGQCSDSVDNDGDGLVNDGCPQSGAAEPEFDWQCDNAVDDDPRDDLTAGAQKVNDGCPAVGVAETACSDAVDNDGDRKVNDGCPTVGGANSEVNECGNAVDDDADAYVNDGCPAVGSPLVGGVAGKIFNDTLLALANNPCSNSLSPSAYPLFASTTENAVWNEFPSLPQGSVGSEGPLEPFRDDANGDGLPRHVERYPTFLNKLFDPDRVGDINGDGDEFDAGENPGASSSDPYGTIEPLRPLARYSGSTLISGEAHLVQILVFSPGTLAAFQPPHPLSDFGAPALGYPMVVVVDDPLTPPGPGSVTDNCTPSDTRILLWGTTRDNPCTGGSCTNDNEVNNPPGLIDSGTGPCSGTNEAGCIRYANPSTAGTHLFYLYQQSQRDWDNDGKENSLDTCPLNYDTLDARTGAGPDTDDDLIANACDTNGNGSNDSDTDGFVNTQDNCPQNANASQVESETITPYATAAKRGGSRADGMGDACDPNPTKADGHFHTVLTAVPKCIGATDSDGDGWCNTDESTYGSNSNNAASTPEHYDLFMPLPLTHSGSGNNPATPSPESGNQCLGLSDDDGDAFVNDGCPITGNSPESGPQCNNSTDDDGDTFANDGCPAVADPETLCNDTTDDDSDGYVNDGCPTVSGESGALCWGSADEDGDGFVNDGCPAQVARPPLQLCNDGVDNDLDGYIDALDSGCEPAGLPSHPGYPACPTNGCVGVDTDGDGYTDEAEVLIGTDALGRCEVGAVPGQSTDWPSDFVSGGIPNSTDKVNITDQTSFLAPVRRLDTSPGDPAYDPRWDLVPGPGVFGTWINVQDYTALIAGPSGYPPMLDGVKAFNGPPCTAHPAYGD